MSVDYSKLEYLSIYGSDFAVFANDAASIRYSGSATASSFVSATVNFNFGYPQVGSVGDADYKPSAEVPNALNQFFINGDTPNDPDKWYDIDLVPRPILIPTSGGNVGLRVWKHRLPVSTTYPTTWVFTFEIFNPYGVTVTFDYTFNYITYCIANT